MEAFQQRVVEERTELGEKLEKLNSFIGGSIYSKLSSYDQILLAKQMGIMEDYYDVLSKRIAAFK